MWWPDDTLVVCYDCSERIQRAFQRLSVKARQQLADQALAEIRKPKPPRYPSGPF
jgi:hypothetical protein